MRREFQISLPAWLISIMDLAIVVASVMLAYLLRFNFAIPVSEIALLPPVLIFVPGIRVLTFILIKSYSGITKESGFSDYFRMMLILIAGSLIFLVSDIISYYFISHTLFIPLTIIILEFLITSFFMVAFRNLVKSGYNTLRFRLSERSNTIIYGTGEEATLISHLLEGDKHIRYQVLAFVAERNGRSGKKIEGIDVMSPDELHGLFKNHPIDQLILARRILSNQEKQALVDLCRTFNTRLLTVLPKEEWKSKQPDMADIKEITIEDFLERGEVRINRSSIEKEVRRKTILVTGAGGVIGSELVRQLLKFDPGRIVLVDQDENSLMALAAEFENYWNRDPFRFVVADICNESRMEGAFEEHTPQLVFHAAAYKRIPTLEKNPSEAISINVNGTKILADLALRHKVEKFILVSTDKASRPSTVMGRSKQLAELYLNALNGQGKTLFIATRFGDIPDGDEQRFYLTIPELCQLVLETGAMAKSGGIFRIDMRELVQKPELATRMIQLSGLTLGSEEQERDAYPNPAKRLIEEFQDSYEETAPTSNPLIRRMTDDG